MREVDELSNMIAKEVFKKPKKDIKLISNVDTFDLAYDICLSLRKTIDEPLVHTFYSVGRTALRLSGVKELEEDETSQCVWIGNRLLIPLVERDIINFKREEPEDWNAPIATSSWNIRKDGDSIYLKQDKSKWETYSLEILDQEWFDGLLSNLPEEEVETLDCGQPQYEEIEPFEAFYHPKTGEPLVHRSARSVRRALEKGKYSKFRNIINDRLALRYTTDQEIVQIYEQMKKDPIFTLSKKNMNAKQKKSIKDERKWTIQTAKSTGDKDFAFYHFYDKRVGRIYSSGSFYKPDGSKLSKSMIRLKNGKRIGTDGWFWLMINLANTFGEDKISLDDRFNFAEEHLDEWMVWANDPHYMEKRDWDGNGKPYKARPWTKVDSPFEFLAGIIEVKRALALENKYDFVSNLIVFFDASQSGLQILSALVNDEISGSMCNVFGNKANDFYLSIAEYAWKDFVVNDGDVEIYNKVMKSLKNVKNRVDFNNAVEKLGNNFLIAANVYWSRKAKDMRKLTKTPAMTYFYSCQKETMAEALYKTWRVEPGYEDLNPGFAIVLSEKLYYSCKKIMRRPTKIMNVIIKAAERDRKLKGEQFSCWTPYTGVRMEQTYWMPKKSRRLWVSNPKIEGKGLFRINVWQGFDFDKINYHKVKSSSSPNYVHMLDSQLIAMLIDTVEYDISCIHDAFGAVAADSGKLFEDVRQCFVDLFSKPILENMLKDKGYDDLIEELEFGTGDINDIFNNEPAFC